MENLSKRYGFSNNKECFTVNTGGTIFVDICKQFT